LIATQEYCGESIVTELLLRALIGGVVVSAFAVVGDLLRPKRFAGLFGAAPSVALATLALTIVSDGKNYAATEARSMLGGVAAFFVYACCTCVLIMRYRPPAKLAALLGLPIWLGVAFGSWLLFLR
jgi:uncharacterized membrane protein (GlpM family)